MVVDKPQACPYPFSSCKAKKGEAGWEGLVGSQTSVGRSPTYSNWDEGEGQVGSGLGTQGPRTKDSDALGG